MRICVDYRQLNAITLSDSYPMVRIDEAIECLHDRSIFSLLDCRSGYWQVPLAAENRPKSTFICKSGLCRWKVMPFGLKDAPATFQRLMDRVLKSTNNICTLVYFDDILVFSKTQEDHLKHLETVFGLLRSANLSLNLSKCRSCNKK